MARLSFWYFQILFSPVDGEHNEHQGGENIAAGPHHHQPLARKVPRVPLQAEFSTIFCTSTSMHDNDEVSEWFNVSPHFARRTSCFLWFCNANTSITTLQMVSIGIVMKQTIASARVRWKTKKWTFVRLCISYLPFTKSLLIGLVWMCTS